MCRRGGSKYVQERVRSVFVKDGEFVICAGFRLCKVDLGNIIIYLH